MKMQRVQWKKLTNEPLQCGDMWAGHDPNTLERQGEPDYNLMMQAVHPVAYGKSPDSGNPATTLGNGAYWRPCGIVTLTESGTLTLTGVCNNED